MNRLVNHIPTILFVPILFILIAGAIVALACAPETLKSQLTPLLSIIKGQVFLKFRGRMFAVLKGTWQGEKVEVEIKQQKYISNLFITLFGPCPLSCSLKIRPTSGVVGLVDMHVGALLDGHRFKIPEANITVYSSTGNETIIRQFLNPDRLWVIENIFSHHLNYLEIHKDPIAGDYLRVGIEGCRMSDSISACQAILQPAEMNYILLKLIKFYTAPQSPKNHEPILSSPSSY